MRQIVLDTETTGLDPAEGHRIIEIGCVEIINRRMTGNTFHHYVNPGRDIDSAAIEVHGITKDFLTDKPRFPAIASDLLEFVKGAELIIHNAPFDVGFINYELGLIAPAGATPSLTNAVTAVVTAPPLCACKIEEACTVVDTLALARSMHPGQKNDLDSLCKRYSVDNTQRTVHGALLDAEILADVYLVMTGGQTGLFEDHRGPHAHGPIGPIHVEIRRIDANRAPLLVVAASSDEVAAHQLWVEEIDSKSGGRCLWKVLT